MKEYFGTKHVFLVSSGKAALFLILSGLKRLTGKKKVILPAYTCFSVPSSSPDGGIGDRVVRYTTGNARL